MALSHDGLLLSLLWSGRCSVFLAPGSGRLRDHRVSLPNLELPPAKVQLRQAPVLRRG